MRSLIQHSTQHAAVALRGPSNLRVRLVSCVEPQASGTFVATKIVDGEIGRTRFDQSATPLGLGCARDGAAEEDERKARPMIDDIEGKAEAASPNEERTAHLIRVALDETRELVQLEVALAREEFREEVAQAKMGGIALGLAAMAGVSAFAMFMVTVALAFVVTWLAACLMGGILLLLSLTAGILGWRALPKRPLGATRARLESGYKQLKERLA
jgi:uncharacterized membrane protein YqjE